MKEEKSNSTNDEYLVEISLEELLSNDKYKKYLKDKSYQDYLKEKSDFKESKIMMIDFRKLEDVFQDELSYMAMKDLSEIEKVEEVKEEAKQLMQVTHDALFKGLEQVKEGARLGDVSAAIGNYANSFGYGVVEEFTGHGVGKELHEDPVIFNFGKAGTGPILKEGMVLAIEPMVIQGSPNILELDDGWTIITEDGSLSAHYENTILITENEPEILTKL